MSSSTVDPTVAHTHGSSGPVTLVIRLLTEPAVEGRLVGHAQVVRTGELVPITSTSDLEQLARRVAAAEMAPGDDLAAATGRGVEHP